MRLVCAPAGEGGHQLSEGAVVAALSHDGVGGHEGAVRACDGGRLVPRRPGSRHELADPLGAGAAHGVRVPARLDLDLGREQRSAHLGAENTGLLQPRHVGLVGHGGRVEREGARRLGAPTGADDDDETAQHCGAPQQAGQDGRSGHLVHTLW